MSGQPSGLMPSKKVYSCSIPNHMSKSAYFSAASAQAALVFDGCGERSGSRTSHIARMLSPPRIGSGHVNTGRNTQSEFSPGAWFVLDPSKPPDRRLLPFWHYLALGPKLRYRLRPVYPDILRLVNAHLFLHLGRWPVFMLRKLLQRSSRTAWAEEEF